MKKMTTLSMILVLMLTLLTACGGNAPTAPSASDAATTTTAADLSGTTATTAATTTVGELSVEQAKTAALSHAGVAETDVTGLRVEMDFDDGRRHYDVEFFVNGTEYDYEIDAKTGAVISYDVDGTPGTTAAAATNSITAEQAQTIALEHAGLTTDGVTRLRADYEIDDGIPHYDVHFEEGRVEYEYEIHAESGAILSYDKGD